MYAFVYGTLRKGDSRFGVLDDCKCISAEAYLDDHFMISLGSFPGILPGKGRVRGEVYEIDDNIRAILDGIEGYREDDPKHSLYIRTVVEPVHADGGSIGKCNTYIYNDERSHRPLHDLIESGDWFEHRPPYVPRSQEA